jgi:hypothetical protein
VLDIDICIKSLYGRQHPRGTAGDGVTAGFRMISAAPGQECVDDALRSLHCARHGSSQAPMVGRWRYRRHQALGSKSQQGMEPAQGAAQSGQAHIVAVEPTRRVLPLAAKSDEVVDVSRPGHALAGVEVDAEVLGMAMARSRILRAQAFREQRRVRRHRRLPRGNQMRGLQCLDALFGADGKDLERPAPRRAPRALEMWPARHCGPACRDCRPTSRRVALDRAAQERSWGGSRAEQTKTRPAKSTTDNFSAPRPPRHSDRSLKFSTELCPGFGATQHTASARDARLQYSKPLLKEIYLAAH